MALKDIIQKDVTAIKSTATLKDVAKLMYQNHIGAVVVVDKMNGVRKTPVGIITDRDIALSLGKNGKLDPNCSVKEVMTPNVVMCSPEDGIYETIHKMRTNGIRRIPVVNKKDQLVGIIASDDLIKLLGSEINDLSQIITLETEKESHVKKPVNKKKQLTTRPRAAM